MSTATPARTRDYIDNKELAKLVAKYQRTKKISDELSKALIQIAGGIWDRYRFTADKDEFVQEVFLHWLQSPLQRADTQKHVFNYLSTCAIRYGIKLRGKTIGDRLRFETYAAELVEAGRELPPKQEPDDADDCEE